MQDGKTNFFVIEAHRAALMETMRYRIYTHYGKFAIESTDQDSVDGIEDDDDGPDILLFDDVKECRFKLSDTDSQVRFKLVSFFFFFGSYALSFFHRKRMIECCGKRWRRILRSNSLLSLLELASVLKLYV